MPPLVLFSIHSRKKAGSLAVVILSENDNILDP